MLWSMQCLNHALQVQRHKVRFVALIDEKSVAEATLPAAYLAKGVTVREVTEEGIIGRFYRPVGPGPFPALIVLGGSEGGIESAAGRASHFANHGIAALALPYFNYPGLPPELKNIRLEYFEDAIRWMRRQPEVIAQKLGVVGASRGGELSLVLASRFTALKAVVAIVPSSVVWPGLSKDEEDPPSWTYRGEALPRMRQVDGSFGDHATVERLPDGSIAFSYTPAFLHELTHEKIAADARIPVEQIRGPVLLLGAEDDKLWPSCEFARRVHRTLIAAHLPVEMHCLPEAGHTGTTLPGLPTTFPYGRLADREWMALGGTAKGNASAQQSTVEMMDGFLKRAFAP
jgi:dienelactone hydrolase